MFSEEEKVGITSHWWEWPGWKVRFTGIFASKLIDFYAIRQAVSDIIDSAQPIAN